MKKITLLFFAVVSILSLNAQETSVEKSIFGLQIGTFGVYGYNESRLSDEVTLRTELGFDAGLLLERGDRGSDLIFTPNITLEPRWYYNLDKRQSKGYQTDANSGNFLSLKVIYNPDWFVLNDPNQELS